MIREFIIAIRVSNRFGVLTRVSSMFSRRGFNIDSLTVSITETPGVSRITITMQGDDGDRNQIIKQLTKLHEVLEISEMETAKSVIREFMLIKIKSNTETRQEVMDAVGVFRGNVIDYGSESIIVGISGESQKVKAFTELMEPFGILEICRTGAVALERGTDCLRLKDMNYINGMTTEDTKTI